MSLPCLAPNDPRPALRDGRGGGTPISAELPDLSGLGPWATCGECGLSFAGQDRLVVCACGRFHPNVAPPRAPSREQIAAAMRLMRGRRHGLAATQAASEEEE